MPGHAKALWQHNCTPLSHPCSPLASQAHSTRVETCGGARGYPCTHRSLARPAVSLSLIYRCGLLVVTICAHAALQSEHNHQDALLVRSPLLTRGATLQCPFARMLLLLRICCCQLWRGGGRHTASSLEDALVLADGLRSSKFACTLLTHCWHCLLLLAVSGTMA